MINKSLVGLSPSFNLTVGNAQVNYQALNALELFLEDNKHDMLLISLAGIPTRAVTEYRNLGVRFTFDTGPGYSDSFTGFVTEVRPYGKTAAGLLNDSPFQDVIIVCLGTSYSMRGSKSRHWTDSRLQTVAETFARSYGMSLDVPDDPILYKSIVQDNESDWQFLVRYAGLLGLSVSAHNTHLHIFDPTKAAGRRISFNKLVTSRAANGNTTASPGQVTKFQGVFADRHPDGVYKNSVVTVQQPDGVTYDVTSREVFGVTGSTPARFEDRLPQYVTNYEEAVRAIQSHSKEHYDYAAEVECLGLAGVQPGGLVDLDNYNAEYDGLWYVKQVHHTLTSGVFLTNLSIARNAKDVDRSTNTQRFQRPPLPVWVNGSWQSSKRQYHAY